MTPPVTTEALAEALAECLLRHEFYSSAGTLVPFSEQDASVRRHWIGKARAAIAGPLAPLLAAHQQVTSENTNLRKQLESCAIAVGHSPIASYPISTSIHRLRNHADTALATATSELARLRAEGEAKDRALLLLLPFVDYAAGEGLMFVETEDGEHPEMDAADIVIAAAKEIGLELGSDASEAFLAAGYDAIRAARAATAREGA